MPRAESARGNSFVLRRLYDLFETRMSAETGKPLTGKEIAERARALDHELSPSYVLSLKNRSRTNPSLESLEALAAVYGVGLAYFFTTGEDFAVVDEAMAAAMRDNNVRIIALRAAVLSPQTQAILVNLADDLVRLDAMRRESVSEDQPPRTDEPGSETSSAS